MADATLPSNRDHLFKTVAIVAMLLMVATIAFGVNQQTELARAAAAKKADIEIRLQQLEARQTDQAKEISAMKVKQDAQTLWMVQAMQIIEPNRKQFWESMEKRLLEKK